MRLPLGVKMRLAVEVVGTYVHVRILLARGGLAPTVERLRRAPSGPIRFWPSSQPQPDGRRLGRAVQRTLGPLPGNTRCLMQSLVLLRLLTRRRVAAELVIAVRPGGELALDAHAWIEQAGTPLLAPAGPGFGRLLTL